MQHSMKALVMLAFLVLAAHARPSATNNARQHDSSDGSRPAVGGQQMSPQHRQQHNVSAADRHNASAAAGVPRLAHIVSLPYPNNGSNSSLHNHSWVPRPAADSSPFPGHLHPLSANLTAGIQRPANLQDASHIARHPGHQHTQAPGASPGPARIHSDRFNMSTAAVPRAVPLVDAGTNGSAGSDGHGVDNGFHHQHNETGTDAANITRPIPDIQEQGGRRQHGWRQLLKAAGQQQAAKSASASNTQARAGSRKQQRQGHARSASNGAARAPKGSA